MPPTITNRTLEDLLFAMENAKKNIEHHEKFLSDSTLITGSYSGDVGLSQAKKMREAFIKNSKLTYERLLYEYLEKVSHTVPVLLIYSASQAKLVQIRKALFNRGWWIDLRELVGNVCQGIPEEVWLNKRLTHLTLKHFNANLEQVAKEINVDSFKMIEYEKDDYTKVMFTWMDLVNTFTRLCVNQLDPYFLVKWATYAALPMLLQKKYVGNKKKLLVLPLGHIRSTLNFFKKLKAYRNNSFLLTFYEVDDTIVLDGKKTKSKTRKNVMKEKDQKLEMKNREMKELLELHDEIIKYTSGMIKDVDAKSLKPVFINIYNQIITYK